VGRDGEDTPLCTIFKKPWRQKYSNFPPRKLKDGDAWYFKTFLNFLLIFRSSHPCNFQKFLSGNSNIFAIMDFLKFQG
jgi:hypothetical protein